MIGNKLEPFKFWCQKVLPNVYDDSLSYYEYLCKLNEYLNEVIEQINTLTDNMEDYESDLSAQWSHYKEALNAEWAETKNYIDNYFNNLNVQTEINNKLDAMALDGTLSTLLAPYVSQQIGGVVADQIGATVANQIGGTVANQIDAVVADQIAIPTATATASWLTAHVDPVGSAVIVDDSLSISGAAADAKVTGNKINSIEIDNDYVGNELLCEKYEIYDTTIDSDGIISEQANWKTVVFRIVPNNYVESASGTFDRYALYTNKVALGSVSYNNSRTLASSISFLFVPSGCNWLAISVPNDGRNIDITPKSYKVYGFEQNVEATKAISKIEKESAYAKENTSIPYYYVWSNGVFNDALNPVYDDDFEKSVINIDADMWLDFSTTSPDVLTVRKKDTSNVVTKYTAPCTIHFNNGDTLYVAHYKGYSVKIIWVDNPNRVYDVCNLISEIGLLKGKYISVSGNIGNEANSYITNRVFIPNTDGWLVFENNLSMGNDIACIYNEYNPDGELLSRNVGIKARVRKGYQYRISTYQCEFSKIMFYKKLPSTEGIIAKVERGVMTDSGNLYVATTGYRLTLSASDNEWFRFKLASGYHMGFLRPNSSGVKNVLSGFIGMPYMDIVINYSATPYVVVYADDNSDMTFDDYDDIVLSVERINKRGNGGYDIVVAPYNATSLDKENADIVCDGTNDEYELNLALNCNISMSGIKATKVKLLSGDYNIDSFHNNSFARTGTTGVGISGIELKRIDTNEYRELILDGEEELTTKIKVTLNAYQDVVNESAIISTARVYNASYPTGNSANAIVLYMSNLTLDSYDWEKPIICLDGSGMTMFGVEHIHCTSATSHYSPTWDTALDDCNDGCIGIRGIRGSNFGTNAYIKHCAIEYKGQALALTGEHFIIEDVGIHSSKVGITVDNYKVPGQMEHPNVFIGCGIEKCYRLGILTKDGITVEQTFEQYRNNGGTGNRETIIYIGGSSEAYWRDSETVVHASLPFKEIVKGAYRGRIETDLNGKVFETGSGENVSTTRYTSEGSTYVHNVGISE